jgi:GntR family transcriptional regulator/MocR family aminotransferase
MVAAHGGEVVPVPVDDDGIRVDELVAADPDVVVLTPAHQFPTGVTLAGDRRRELVAWAHHHDRLLVEDDYDAEFRYEPSPPGALQPLAPDHVAYAGTLSKTLAPGLRLGWLVLPEWLVGGVIDAKRAAGAESSVLDQLAFAEFVRSHRYDRHLRRMRALFRRRRDRFLAALDAGVPHLKVSRTRAGVHLVVELPDGGPGESDVLAVARQAGVGLFGLQPCWHGTPRSQGVMVGFGRPPEHAVDDAVHGLVHVLDRATR